MIELPEHSKLFKQVDTVDSIRAALNELFEKGKELGVRSMSYHLTPPFHSQVSKVSTVFHFGVKPKISKLYLDPSIFESDPIPDFVMRAGKPMTFLDAIKSQKLSEEQKEFSKLAMEHGFVDGIAAPLFGPGGRNSYVSFNFDRKMSAQDIKALRPLIQFAHSVHRRICAFSTEELEESIELSLREQEVLYWMSRGKSSSDMATIMGISVGTIDTYVKRIFRKMGVHDRISAVIVGLGRSLIFLK